MLPPRLRRYARLPLSFIAHLSVKPGAHVPRALCWNGAASAPSGPSSSTSVESSPDLVPHFLCSSSSRSAWSSSAHTCLFSAKSHSTDHCPFCLSYLPYLSYVPSPTTSTPPVNPQPSTSLQSQHRDKTHPTETFLRIHLASTSTTAADAVVAGSHAPSSTARRVEGLGGPGRRGGEQGGRDVRRGGLPFFDYRVRKPRRHNSDSEAFESLLMHRAVRDCKYEVNEGRMTEECSQYLAQLEKDWERHRVKTGGISVSSKVMLVSCRKLHSAQLRIKMGEREREREEMCSSVNDADGIGTTPSTSTSSMESIIQCNIDLLFDRDQDASAWEPARPPDVLGEFLDSRTEIRVANFVNPPPALDAQTFSKVVTVVDAPLVTSTVPLAMRASSSNSALFLSGKDILAYLRTLNTSDTKIIEIDFAALKAGTAAGAVPQAKTERKEKEADYTAWYTNVCLTSIHSRDYMFKADCEASEQKIQSQCLAGMRDMEVQVPVRDEEAEVEDSPFGLRGDADLGYGHRRWASSLRDQGMSDGDSGGDVWVEAEADMLEMVWVAQHIGEVTRQSNDDARALVIVSLHPQVQDLFSQVIQFDNKLIKSYDHVSDLEHDLHVSQNLRTSSLKISQCELEHTQHLSALNTGLLVEKAQVTAELMRLMEKATDEAVQRGLTEGVRAETEKDLDDLSTRLFN
ncbi:hypothetical protein EW146_g1612 [Bondarzewia mesenterica]|uniref:Uncharacterized protein n=1 Tax=Bondarzewia mesenterica TaxID=1095465 RepID=A0A4S4M548_9AGAM|nr:hypothetical protein EW146_g1612 [Bondarzewia mesenterica]